MAEGEEELLRDAKIVKAMLKSMGAEDYEPRVIHQFLDPWYSYVVDVLTDAQVYSEHAGKTSIDSDDVKLAIQSKVNFSFGQPPPREVIYGGTNFIMIYSGLDDIAKAKSIAAKVIQEVNKRCSRLEIDLDSVYKRILLLKKKKYAAIKEQFRDGKVYKVGPKYNFSKTLVVN